MSIYERLLNFVIVIFYSSTGVYGDSSVQIFEDTRWVGYRFDDNQLPNEFRKTCYIALHSLFPLCKIGGIEVTTVVNKDELKMFD